MSEDLTDLEVCSAQIYLNAYIYVAVKPKLCVYTHMQEQTRMYPTCGIKTFVISGMAVLMIGSF